MARITGPDTAKYVEEALDKHCKMTQGLMPGFLALHVDTDIHLAAWQRMIPGPVTFHMSVKECEEKGMNAPLYLFQFNQEEIERKIAEAAELHEREVEGEGEDGLLVIDEPLSLQGQLTQLAVPGRDWPLMYGEVPMWLAVYDAEQAGDVDLAHRIFEQGYVPVKSDLPADLIDAPIQDVVPIRENVQGNSKISNYAHLMESGKLQRFDMAGDNDLGRIESSLILSYDNNNVSMDRPMTQYDRTVHNAVATLWRAGARSFRVNQVYEAMTGSAANPRAETLQKVAESIDKQLHTSATLDFTDELRGETLNDDGKEVTVENAFLETHVLNGNKGTIICSDGEARVGYTLHEPPLLYRHDKITGQYVRYPHRVLKAVSKAVRPTETNTLIRDYLIRRIAVMKNGKTPMAKNRRIQFSAIYEAAGKPGATRTEKDRIRKAVGKMLDAMDEAGYIDGWDLYAKAGQTRPNGVTIELETANKERRPTRRTKPNRP